MIVLKRAWFHKTSEKVMKEMCEGPVDSNCCLVFDEVQIIFYGKFSELICLVSVKQH